MRQNLVQGLDSTWGVAYSSSRTLLKSSFSVDIWRFFAPLLSLPGLLSPRILSLSIVVSLCHPIVTSGPNAKPPIAFPDRKIESHDVTVPPWPIDQILTYPGNPRE